MKHDLENRIEQRLQWLLRGDEVDLTEFAADVRSVLAKMQARVEQAEARVEQLERALHRVKYESVSLADAQVIALEALKGQQ